MLIVFVWARPLRPKVLTSINPKAVLLFLP
jgi:hypothetical protein